MRSVRRAKNDITALQRKCVVPKSASITAFAFPIVVITWLACATVSLSTTVPHSPTRVVDQSERSQKQAAQRPTAVELRVFPAEISLSGKRDKQSIVAQLVMDNGVTRDVSTEIKITVDDPKIVRRDGSTFFPANSGQTNVTVKHRQLTVTIPTNVAKAQQDTRLSFQLDVMPVFSKTGCNSGSCHGAARGKDGFRLSLFGYDPAGDHFRLTREMLGRRIDVATPDDCMLTNKSTGRVAHSGGTVFPKNSPYYRTLRRWIAEGATYDGKNIPVVQSVQLMPPSSILDGTGATQQLSVLASYSDDTTRDVTDLAFFSSSDSSVAPVSQTGLVTGGQRGEAFVMARFGTHTVGSEFVTLPKSRTFTPQPMPEQNFIDRHINAKLKRLQIAPSRRCSDEIFIRRVSLDICGVVPTEEQIKTFLDNHDLDKRSQLIDQLLEQDAFVSIWVMKWSELLRIRSTLQFSVKSTRLYHDWLKQKLASNTPVDQIVRELLSASGGTFENPAANFYETERDPLKLSENVAQVFMGMRIQCAQCHNHPFDRWTMEDYYSFAAFFAKVKRKITSDPRERMISAKGGGETRHPVTKKVMQPKFLGGEFANVKGKDRRVVFAQWLTDKTNPYFSQNLANIVWAHFFGRGIIDEVDDVRISNPPVNAALLADLANNFSQSGYDLKKMVRMICNSSTYQLSTDSNATNHNDFTNFSRAYLRRLPAEVLIDVIAQVTGTSNKFSRHPAGTRAIEIADGSTSSYFLETFGRSKRLSVCSCEVKKEPNLSQALHLINGDTIERKIREGNLIQQWQIDGLTEIETVQRLYYRVLGRPATDQEMRNFNMLLDDVLDDESADEVKKEILEDTFWALLNSSEFLFNH